MLTVDGLAFRYGQTPVFEGVCLSVARGRIVGLIGPNGAGKSTLMKCIAGISRPSAGRIILGDRPLQDYARDERARHIAYVPQHSSSALALQVFDIVALGRAPHRYTADRKADDASIWSAIERLDLAALAFRFFGELSGGQRQRVLLARALAQEGRLILMDEPTSNLDYRYQIETLDTIRTVCDEDGVAVLIILHDLSLAARWSDDIVLLSNGSIHAAGDWKAVLTPENLEQSYGISAIVGSDQGRPYVLPIRSGA